MNLTHLYLVIDESGSMYHLADQARQVAQGWVNAMVDVNTVVNVTYFAWRTRPVVVGYRPMSVAPGNAGVVLPALRPDGSTALRDAFLEAVQSAQLQLNQDPSASALVLVVTDGFENASRTLPEALKTAINHLRLGGRADMALMVPPGQREEARRAVGLHTEDVREWETTSEGLRRADEMVTRSLGEYKAQRAAGVRSVGRFFVDPVQAAAAVQRAPAVSSRVDARRVAVFPVPARAVIEEFATSRTGAYVLGQWYYQLMKKETIQPHKGILVRGGDGGFYDGPEARRLLGLPLHGEVKVDASALATSGVSIFVQSTSTNRILPAGTQVVRLTPLGG